MRRNNMVQQFTGEPDPLSQGVDGEGTVYDEVEIDIKGGKVSVVVPAGTPDDAIWNDPRTCLLEIETEDGQVLQFEVNHDGSGSIL